MCVDVGHVFLSEDTSTKAMTALSGGAIKWSEPVEENHWLPSTCSTNGLVGLSQSSSTCSDGFVWPSITCTADSRQCPFAPLDTLSGKLGGASYIPNTQFIAGSAGRNRIRMKLFMPRCWGTLVRRVWTINSGQRFSELSNAPKNWWLHSYPLSRHRVNTTLAWSLRRWADEGIIWVNQLTEGHNTEDNNAGNGKIIRFITNGPHNQQQHRPPQNLFAWTMENFSETYKSENFTNETMTNGSAVLFDLSLLFPLPELELPLKSQCVLVALYAVTTVLSLAGNLLVIIVLSCGTKARTILNKYLINLSVAGLSMACFCIPFSFTKTMLGHWVFGAAMCPIVLFMQVTSVAVNILTNVAIGVDR